MKASKRIGRVFANGLLLFTLTGLLIAYLVVVSDLPARVYTAAQQEYLVYNEARSVSQLPPTWNVAKAGDQQWVTSLPGLDSRVRAILHARHEEQDGVSVTLYDLAFHGQYHLAVGLMNRTIEVFFPFPANLETLHDVRFTVNGEEPLGTQYSTRGIGWQAVLQPGIEYKIDIQYQADGASSFAYGLHREQRADIDVAVEVVGLNGSAVPKASLPASGNEITEGGETWTWQYEALIPNRDIRLTLPSRLSFAQRVAALQDDFRALAWLAPVLVGLFLASLAGAFHLNGVRLGLTAYLLTGCGLALFYPLLTFLSGMVNLTLAAAMALLLVSGLLLAFLSLTVGWRRAGWRAVLLLAVYLGCFSLGLLTPWRGLLLTSGGLLLVGSFMVLYARRPPAPEPEPAPSPSQIAPAPQAAPSPSETEPEPEPVPSPGESEPELAFVTTPEEVAQPESAALYCPHCARALAEDYGFCPGCGHETSRLRRCAGCGHQQFLPAEMERVYCLRCGELLSADS